MITTKTFTNIPLLSICFDENATVQELFQVAAVMTVWWLVFFYIFCSILRPIVRGREFLKRAGSRDYDRGGKQLMETIGNPLSKEEFIDQFMKFWPWTLAVVSQHFVGGILVVPSLLNIGDSTLQNGLVCLAIVSEMGWEIGDLMGWIYDRYFTKGGKKKAAAAVALAVAEYTKMLDVSKPNQLFQFQFLSGVSLAVMVWTRLFDWFYNCYMLIETFYEEDAMTFFYVSIFSALLFTAFSVLICIIPCFVRFVKFLKKKAEYNSLPANADPKTRRASMIAMQDAAAKVMSNQKFMQEELLELLQSTKRTPSKPNRRDTIPANFARGKRSSVNMSLLRSSMGNLDMALVQLHMADFKNEKMD